MSSVFWKFFQIFTTLWNLYILFSHCLECIIEKVRSWMWDSNPQPADYKSAALPIELTQHFNIVYMYKKEWVFVGCAVSITRRCYGFVLFDSPVVQHCAYYFTMLNKTLPTNATPIVLVAFNTCLPANNHEWNLDIVTVLFSVLHVWMREVNRTKNKSQYYQDVHGRPLKW